MQARTHISCDKNGHAHQPHEVRLTQQLQWASQATVHPTCHGRAGID